MKGVKRRHRFLVISVVVGLASLVACSARAAIVEGVRFAESVHVGERRLDLQGAALLRYRVFLKAYVAAYYLAPDEEARASGDRPRRMEIEYFWSIPAEGFAEATRDGVARSAGARAYAALATRVEQLNGRYRDVEPGDRYALTYVPGRGTELSLNGQALGVVEGADFAAALFDIWLGPEPLDRELREALVGS